MTDRELLGWVKIEEVRQHFDTAGCGTIYKTGGEGRVPLYTTPQREWVGLTAQDLADVGPENYIGAIWADAKLKEKNEN
jgi:hypothetical protein